MIFPDLTPTYLASPPSERLLRVVHNKVRGQWVQHYRRGEFRSSGWDELLLAARYFRIRKEVLVKSLEDSKGATEKPFYKHPILWIRMAIRSNEQFAIGLAFFSLTLVTVALGINMALNARQEPILYTSVYFSLSSVFYTLAMAFVLIARIGQFGPAFELAEIETFDSLVPNAAQIVSNEELTKTTTQDIETLAHSSPGAPITPPGLTELTLSRDNSSLQSIRDQLRTTRLADVGMTAVSFLAFIAGVTFCFWQLAETDRIAQGLIGVGGSGLIGLFCFYSTGRARSSQIALALFESLVAELTVSLDSASQAAIGERGQLERAAWREFRIALNDLYMLERNQKTKAKSKQPKTSGEKKS